jgi:hypothetical protein
MVWEITASGQYRDLHDFGGTVTYPDGTSGPDGQYPMAGVTFDAAGNMYGTTSGGGLFPRSNVLSAGDGGDGMVWEITASGLYRDLHNFGSWTVNSDGSVHVDGSWPRGRVTFDRAGNMVGTASSGGGSFSDAWHVYLGYTYGMVWQITSSGTYLDLHDFNTSVSVDGETVFNVGVQPFGDVTVDPEGNMFGTTCAGGPNRGGMIWEITAEGTCLDLHDFGGTIINASGTRGPDGANPQTGVTLDGAGNIFGTTTYGGPTIGGIVWELTAKGGYLDLHDFGELVVWPNGYRGYDSAFPAAGVTVDEAGNVYGTANMGPFGPWCAGYGMVWCIGPSQMGLSLSSGSVLGGGSVTATATLSHGAPTGGLDLHVSSSSLNATVPETVRFPAGATSATFTVSTRGVDSTVTVKITGGTEGVSHSATLTILPPTLAAVGLDSAAVTGGADCKGRVSLTGPAGPHGVVVKLASSSKSARVPRYVTVNRGRTLATFTADTTKVVTAAAATISAAVGNTSQSAVLTVNP